MQGVERVGSRGGVMIVRKIKKEANASFYSVWGWINRGYESTHPFQSSGCQT